MTVHRYLDGTEGFDQTPISLGKKSNYIGKIALGAALLAGMLYSAHLDQEDLADPVLADPDSRKPQTVEKDYKTGIFWDNYLHEGFTSWGDFLEMAAEANGGKRPWSDVGYRGEVNLIDRDGDGLVLPEDER